MPVSMPDTRLEWLGLAVLVASLAALVAIAITWWRHHRRDQRERAAEQVTLANLMARQRQRWEDAHTTLIQVYDVNAKRGRVPQPEAVTLRDERTVAIPAGITADLPAWASTSTGLRRYLYSGRRR